MTLYFMKASVQTNRKEMFKDSSKDKERWMGHQKRSLSQTTNKRIPRKNLYKFFKLKLSQVKEWIRLKMKLPMLSQMTTFPDRTQIRSLANTSRSITKLYPKSNKYEVSRTVHWITSTHLRLSINHQVFGEHQEI